jgi:hypothetical protein
MDILKDDSQLHSEGLEHNPSHPSPTGMGEGIAGHPID